MKKLVYTVPAGGLFNIITEGTLTEYLNGLSHGGIIWYTTQRQNHQSGLNQEGEVLLVELDLLDETKQERIDRHFKERYYATLQQ